MAADDIHSLTHSLAAAVDRSALFADLQPMRRHGSSESDIPHILARPGSP